MQELRGALKWKIAWLMLTNHGSPGQALGLSLALACLATAGCEHKSPVAAPAPPTLVKFTTANAGFQQALPGYHYHFPFDAGAHPDYRTEWWYYTGHLSSAGRPYGFELTFFRVGLIAHAQPRKSRWATSALYFAHFALSDISARQFHYAQRADRGSLGMAGATVGQERAWVGNWQAEAPPCPGRPADMWPHYLKASASFGGIGLTLLPEKPPAIHGRDGVSQKGPGPGQASHYYSYTRMSVHGTLTSDGKVGSATGMAWMDHEFSSDLLSPDETGWDWISVQLNNGQDLMLYRLRQSDLAAHAGVQKLGSESVSPFSSGTLVQADGHTQPLQSTDFTADPCSWWKSPHTGARYPIGWRIKAPRAGIELSLSPAMDDQELQTAGSTGVTYWEGAVDVSGQSAGKPVSGQGYVELTGYSGGLDGLR